MSQIPSSWTPEMVRSIKASPTTTAPPVDWARRRQTLPGYYVWDTWPIQLPDGQVAGFGAWTVWIMLAAPDSVAPEERHDIARHRVGCVDPNGEWHDGGPLFPEGDPLGSRQWAGSAVYNPAQDRVTFFYTAAGRSGDAAISYEQRIVMTRARIDSSAEGVTFRDWSEHRVILTADERYYKSTRGTRGGPGTIDAFRDPGYFLDPATGNHYMLFTGSLQDSDIPNYDGVVGLARADTDDLESWILLPPVLTAGGVNKELERPHIIVQAGRYYLFFSTHGSTFAPGLAGPEGLYGFVAGQIDGPYLPLNESGLVIQNPDEAPYQAYSWLVLSDGNVISFLYYGGLVGDNPETFNPDWQREHFGGVQAPVLKFELGAAETGLCIESSEGENGT